MSAIRTAEKFRLGFMAALEVDGRGHVGGLLVTSHNGRPLEFQCTTPVKPDRTQEILYGRALKSWLLGELIGSTLLQRVGIKPDLVVVRDEEMLELRNHTETPVAYLSDTAAAGATITRMMGGRCLHFHSDHTADADLLEGRIHLVPDQADLEEPMERVHAALSETVKSVLTR
ncbi:MAG: hypothetical protein MK110_03835 [Fuerstiella sp.]|nr:hypothetical protein [Fuerstiella sp.]